jgi:hypothetical protein
MIAATGRTSVIELYEASTMKRLCSLPYEKVYHLTMTTEQIFFQYDPLKAWCVIDLQESEITRTLQPMCKIPISLKQDYLGFKNQGILYDRVKTGEDTGVKQYDSYVCSIMAKQRALMPNLNLSRYPAYLGGEVHAINLTTQHQ